VFFCIRNLMGSHRQFAMLPNRDHSRSRNCGRRPCENKTTCLNASYDVEFSIRLSDQCLSYRTHSNTISKQGSDVTKLHSGLWIIFDSSNQRASIGKVVSVRRKSSHGL